MVMYRRRLVRIDRSRLCDHPGFADPAGCERCGGTGLIAQPTPDVDADQVAHFGATSIPDADPRGSRATWVEGCDR
jgi:hypothetical protein